MMVSPGSGSVVSLQTGALSGNRTIDRRLAGNATRWETILNEGDPRVPNVQAVLGVGRF